MDVDPVVLFERATGRAAAVMARVGAVRLGDPTRVRSGRCSS